MTVSLVQGPKLDALLGLVDAVANIDGDAAECGVYQGGTLRLIAEKCPHRKVYGFDTFNGLPAEHWQEGEPHNVGDFSDTSLDAVSACLAPVGNVTLRPGLFPESAAGLEDRRFAFVHLDFDFYESTASAIDWFLPRMIRGGVMVFDDFEWPNCPGVRQAIEEAGLEIVHTAPYQAAYWVGGVRGDLVLKYKQNAEKLLRAPDDPEVLLDSFALLLNNSSRAKALHYLPLAARAYKLASDNPNTAFNYASALARAGRNEEAIQLYQKTFELGDATWKAHALYHIGIAFRALGENEQAIKYYRTAVGLDPENYQAQQDIALATMAAGRLNEGLKLFEARHKLAEQRLKQGFAPSSYMKLPKDVRHWQGEDLTDKTITVFHEEGQGDFIQFCRFIPRLKAKAIYLAGPHHNLLEMVSDQFDITGIVPLAGPIDTDFVVGSMTLPWRTGVEYPDVSGAPYMRSEPAKLPRRSKLNVGLVWRGSPAYANDDHRSMKFTELLPLFDLPHVSFNSLQKGDASKEISHAGYDGFVADMDCFLDDWRAAARVIVALDAVVTVDTAVAHLAGALGKPVFMMVTEHCDWRWDRNSERTIWYDSMRVIRQQKQDDWTPCIARVRELLEAM